VSIGAALRVRTAGVVLRNSHAGRSPYPDVVSLTPPTTLNQDTTGNTCIVIASDALAAKHCDA
jgi:hypothetical protein